VNPVKVHPRWEKNKKVPFNQCDAYRNLLRPCEYLGTNRFCTRAAHCGAAKITLIRTLPDAAQNDGALARTRSVWHCPKEALMVDLCWIAIDELTPSGRNARTHSRRQVRQIADSIVTFGFVVPILIDDDGVIIAGHGIHRIPMTQSIPSGCRLLR
jgi:hypothetical protein